MVSWTSTGRLSIKALDPVWAIPTASRSLAEDARSCPEAEKAGPAWSESPKGADTEEESALRTKSGRARMGLWVGDGYLTFTLHRTAGISLTGRNTYSLMFGHGWANASMPRATGELRGTKAGIGTTPVKQKGPLPLAKQIPNLGYCLTVQHPLSGLSFCLDRKSAQGSRFPERELPLRKGTCPGTKGEDGAQACPGCATVNPPDDLCGTLPPCCPSWLLYDASQERGENASKPGRQLWAPGSLCARKGTLLSIPHALVCPRRPRPSLSLMCPS